MTAEREAFVARFGGIYERSPWVAEEACAAAAGVTEVEQLARILARCVDAAGAERKLALICAHPDLAGRAAVRGELTAESSSEQASAGIDQCTPAEYQQFQDLNGRYRDKFGFPFVMAVRGCSRAEILAAFAARIGNDYAAEFATAIQEIHKIARLRLAALQVDA
ncbi:MAG: 2-oxo-4-hydroxy-4-carboxy-5-ureidoimidazoline decarboxylase [Gammaproteobacteria bacterium]|nr:MAG: 2-oxo-4-hydroxy-4-carboxy-5-ureidoimidazoline decarboxylase [Gammaproteobacteria bacterium]